MNNTKLILPSDGCKTVRMHACLTLLLPSLPPSVVAATHAPCLLLS